MIYVLFMTSPTVVEPADLWRLLQKACPEELVRELREKQALPFRRGIYSILVIIWLMMYQRLNHKRTASSAVQWLVRNAASLPNRNACKRVRTANISANNGAYCQARQKLPKLVVMALMDSLFEELQQHMREVLPELARPVFIVDGTTLRTPHGPELVKQFPPGHNQHGQNHWPTLLLVTFHDAYTGLAARPSWGPMYGPEAVSEQYLAEQALGQLPADAIVMADGNFGIFAFAYAVQKTARPMLFRLTLARVRKVLGDGRIRPGRRHKIVWQPSAYERRMHAELPPECRLTGWVVACRNPSRAEEMLYFFTTLDLQPRRILALYKLRWSIETDLRGLKRTVGLHELTSRTPDMVDKELLVAVSAYNLVRATIYRAARREGLCPRDFSFSVAQDAVMAAWSDLSRATTPRQRDQQVLRLVQAVGQAKLPHRRRRRSYPRKIWGRGGHFPQQRSAPSQEPSR
jgi:putative transposase